MVKNEQHKNIIADILIVDDIPDNLRLLATLLQHEGYKVRNAINGELAIESANLKAPDLILLDIMMPGIDGYEVCRQLKQNEHTREIPIIFITAKDNIQDKIYGFDLGAADYITKPLQVAEVLARVENQLKIVRLQRHLNEQNKQLKKEIEKRIKAEKQLKLANNTLELKLEENIEQIKTQNQELLLLKKQLESALEQVNSVNLLKSELISMISHQFRTPLTVIATSNELLKLKIKKNNLDNCDRYFEQINSNVTYITQIVEDVLMLAKIASNDLNFNIEKINLIKFCQSLIKDYSSRKNSNYQINFITIGKGQEYIYGDYFILTKLFNQLINNAIRYSPKGGTILFELIYQPEKVIFRIHDQGIGIPTEEQEKIFERFYRASNANTIPGTPGTGLGLAIVQWAIEKHKGTITVDSKINQGTTITVSLPLNANE